MRCLPRFVLGLLAASAVCPLAGADAHSFVYKGWEELVAEADQIFTGTVVAMAASELANGAIVTDVIFANPRVLKGSGGDGLLTLRILGGTVGGTTLRLSGIPGFAIGREYIVFAKGNGTDAFPVVGGAHGVFRIRRDPATGEEHVFGARGEALWEVPVPLDVFLAAIAEDVRR